MRSTWLHLCAASACLGYIYIYMLCLLVVVGDEDRCSIYVLKLMRCDRYPDTLWSLIYRYHQVVTIYIYLFLKYLFNLFSDHANVDHSSGYMINTEINLPTIEISWRSLLAVEHLLYDKCRKHVGEGCNTTCFERACGVIINLLWLPTIDYLIFASTKNMSVAKAFSLRLSNISFRRTLYKDFQSLWVSRKYICDEIDLSDQ